MSINSSTGQIVGSVNTSDVAYILGSNSTDVKTLCMHPDINKWAKYKPEATGGPGILSDSDRASNNFGLSGPTQVSSTTLKSQVRAGTFNSKWTYKPVSAGYYGRLTDFRHPDRTDRGYDHKAVCPFPRLDAGTLVIDNAGAQSKIILNPPIDSIDGTTISLADMKNTSWFNSNYSGMYPCVALINKDNALVSTAETTLANGAQWEINFGNIPYSYAGDYIAVPLLCDQKITPTYSNGTYLPQQLNKGYYVGLENNGVKMTLLSTSESIVFNYTSYYATQHSLSITITVTNRTATATTISGTNLRLAKDAAGTGAVTVTNATNGTIGNISVPAYGTASVIKRINIPSTTIASPETTHRWFQFYSSSYTGQWTMVGDRLQPITPELTL